MRGLKEGRIQIGTTVSRVSEKKENTLIVQKTKKYFRDITDEEKHVNLQLISGFLMHSSSEGNTYYKMIVE